MADSLANFHLKSFIPKVVITNELNVDIISNSCCNNIQNIIGLDYGKENHEINLTEI